MHSLLIAAFFIAIVLSPCAAALWNRTDPAFPKPPRKHRIRRVEQIADEIEDPWGVVETQRRAVLLKCARSSQLRHLHLHDLSTSGDATVRSLHPSAAARHHVL